MMIIVRFLWYALLIILLLTCLSIVVIGSLWVLRVAVYWWLDTDYVEWLKKKITELRKRWKDAKTLQRRNHNRSR